MKLTWENPPPKQYPPRRTHIDDIVDELKKHPGSWAFVGTKATTGTPYHYKSRGAEYTYRKQAEGGYRLYARWPLESGE